MSLGVFYKIGYYSSAYPCFAVMFCITLTSLLSMGMYNARLETDPQNLWVSPASRTYKEQENFSENFGKFYRTNQLMLVDRNSDEKNLFTYEPLEVIYFIQQIIGNVPAESNGKQIYLDDLCYKPVSGKGCIAPSPMDIWLQDVKLLNEDKDLQFTTLCTESVDLQRTNIPCSDTNGIPVIREAVFGGITCEQRVPDTQPCDHCYIQAKALAVTYLLNNNKFTQADAEIWERDIFMKTLQNLNAVDSNPENENYKWLVEKYNQSPTEKKPVPLSPQILSKYKAVYMAERSIPDELVTETNQNAWVVVLSYFIMFLYISVALGQFPSTVYSSFLLGLGGIFIVGASMLGSIGIISFMSIGLTMISAEVIPFLILAIGVDNMFIITHTFERTTIAKSLEDQMGLTLKSVGPSITTAAICETLAFLVGALTKMPALQNFCIQAACGVFLDFLFQITVFIAFLTWDIKRKQDNRMDCVFCVKKNVKPKNKLFIRNFIKNHYNPLLEKDICRAITGVIFVGLFVVSVIGAMKLQTGLEEQVSLVSQSDLYDYFTVEKKYIEIGPPAYLVLNGFDYDNDTDLAIVEDLSNALSQLNQTVQPPIYSWVASFNNFRRPNAEWSTVCETKDILLDDFPTQLKRFMNTKITSACCQRYGVCGETFQADIVMNEEGRVKTSRLRFQHRPIHNSAEYILTFEQTRQVIDKLASEKFKGNQSAYSYSLPYIFYDQYAYIRAVAIQNILLALAIIFLAITFIQDIICALIVCVTVFIITFNLIGLVWLTNVIFGGFVIEINAISVVNIVTCVGLAVEFCAHIVMKFMKLSGTNAERTREAMLTMGNSVFIGIASTKFIGVIVLAFASSTLFRLYYFRMYFLMIIVGTFNGLCLLPIALTLIGPHKTNRTYSKIDSIYDQSQSISENNSIRVQKNDINK